MFRTKVKIKGKEITLKFGNWVNQEMVSQGYAVADLQELAKQIQENPFKFMPILIHLAACNAKNMDLEDYKLNDFHDFMDEMISSGGVSEIERLQKVYFKSLGVDLDLLNQETIDVKEKVKKQTPKKK